MLIESEWNNVISWQESWFSNDFIGEVKEQAAEICESFFHHGQRWSEVMGKISNQMVLIKQQTNAFVDDDDDDF